jgi:hypothetical protein
MLSTTQHLSLECMLSIYEETICIVDDIINIDECAYLSNLDIYNVILQLYSNNGCEDVESVIHMAVDDYFIYSLKESQELPPTMPPTPTPELSLLSPPPQKKTTQEISDAIQWLKDQPQQEQRTNEWYIDRHNMITASSVWKVFGSQSVVNQLIYEKCVPIDVNKCSPAHVNTDSPLHWGQKFEHLSVKIYEDTFKTKIAEFGCIKHSNPNYHVGASPDGINVCPNSPLYGRALEIKNVVSRPITGIPKNEYWIQVQIQLEICKLDECDFLETQFKTPYDDEDAFNADAFNDDDGYFYTLSDHMRRGVIVQYMKEGKPFYQYAPLHCTKQSFYTWFNDCIETYSDLTWITNIYWKLEVFSCVLIKRDCAWFQNSIQQIENVWSIIEKERVSGYAHRAPRKNIKSHASPTTQQQLSMGCML